MLVKLFFSVLAGIIFMVVWFFVACSTCSICEITQGDHFIYHIKYNWLTRLVWFGLLRKSRWPEKKRKGH